MPASIRSLVIGSRSSCRAKETFQSSKRCNQMIIQKIVFSGGCACGQVRFSANDQPKRIGLCHCMTCRKAHAGAFNPFVVFPMEAVCMQGELRGWESSPGYIRQFCPTCGSRVSAINGHEVEISLGSFDAPGLLTPQYESWIIHREPWLTALQVPQYTHDRGASE
jgi:hypothetical protein